LPQKVLKSIAGKPMLWHVIDRLKKSKLVDEIILATTIKEGDRPLLRIAKKSGIKGFAGSEEDVLDRYFRAATKSRADVVVRITADCPLVDPEIVDAMIKRFSDGGFDYVSNIVKPTYPDGLDVEVFSYYALKRAWEGAKRSSEREHVTTYIRNHPKVFKIGNLEHEKDLSEMRWTVDTDKDLKFVREVYKRLYKKGRIFLMRDVLKLLEKQPHLIEINKGIARDEGYLKSLREDKVIK
jgi:spore coat polysaccharide biosynthesis protein SpsF (cytidylyltransferase family)